MKRNTLFNLLPALSLILALAVSSFASPQTTAAALESTSGELVFWNRLGSMDELQNSEIGANLIVEGNIGFTDGVFGNAFFSTGHWYLGNRIIIPENGLQLDPQQGTVEAWVMYPQDPIVWAYHYSMFSILDGVYQSGPGRDNTLGQQVLSFIGDGVTGDLYTYYVELDFGNKVKIEIPDIDQVFQPGEFHHVAIAWSKDGIDGSNDKIRVYIDNLLMGTSQDDNWGNEPDVGNRHTIGKGEGFDDGTPAFVIDEIKVWNYAKTDFSVTPPMYEPELLTEVSPVSYVEAIHVRDAVPHEIVFVTRNPGAGCGGGTPASAWKMTLDPITGDVLDVTEKQSLSAIQNVRSTLFERSNGTLFTGSGWCGYKPPYLSMDGGETWQRADAGPVHPPNSTFSYAELDGVLYAGTGYAPYHGQVYRWLGGGNWELVLDIAPPRSIVGTMAVYENQLFVGSDIYGWGGSGCASSVPVYISSDGDTFDATTGIPPCYRVRKLLVVGDQLVARAFDYSNPSDHRLFLWNDGTQAWDEISVVALDWHLHHYPGIVAHAGHIYTYGQAPGDSSAGIYRSTNLGQTWQQVAVIENPDVHSLTVHDGVLYAGTYSIANVAYIYRIPLTALVSLVAVEYRWGDPAPGYSFDDWPVFEGWMDVRVENRGDGDAFNVTATVTGWPANTTVPDPDVTVGDIPAGGSAWSTDTFTTHVDMAQPVDPCEGVVWRIEYDDAAGVHYVIENVPEFPPGEGPCD